MFNQYLVGGLVISCIALAGVANQYVDEKSEHAVTMQKLQDSNDTLEAYMAALEDVAKNNADLVQERETIIKSHLKEKRDLNRKRNRESVVLAKKSLVEKLLNKAFIKQQAELACSSGDTALCEQ